MIWYIVIFFFCLLNLYIGSRMKAGKSRMMIEISTLVVLALFAGTRYNIGGSDYFVYQDVFNNVPKLSDFSLVKTAATLNMEQGYLLLNSFIKTLGFSFYGFTLLLSFLFYALFYISLKPYFQHFGFVVIIFLYKLMFFNTFISMRQPIAICIFLFSVRYIVEKKPIKYAALILLGSLFHSSILFLLPLYLLRYIGINRKWFIVINILYIILFLLTATRAVDFNPIHALGWLLEGSPILLEKAGGYFAGVTSINMFNVIEYFMLCALLASMYHKIDFSGKEKKVVVQLLLVTGLVLTMFYNFEIIVRIKDFFIIFYAYILMLIIQRTENYRKKLAIIIITIAVCLIGYLRFPLTFDDGSLIPYRSYTTEHIKIMGGDAE